MTDPSRGRKCQTYAAYTAKRDVPRVGSNEFCRKKASGVSILTAQEASRSTRGLGMIASFAMQCKCAWLTRASSLLGWIMWNMGRAGSVLSEISSSEFQHRITFR